MEKKYTCVHVNLIQAFFAKVVPGTTQPGVTDSSWNDW